MLSPISVRSIPLSRGPTNRRFFATSDINSKNLIVQKSNRLKEKQPYHTLVFGKSFTDHMLSISWSKANGWDAPKIIPHGPLVLDPAAPVFHYGMCCFEGMKAYRDSKNRIRLFRPDMNMERFARSSTRLHLPSFDKKELLECIKELLKIEKDWIPNERGYSLYIRPTHIGTSPSLGVGPSAHSLLYVLLSPVGPYYPEGFKPVKLLADEKYVRAWPGGTGDYKVGGNYAPTILPQVEGAKKGYSQILWLFGPDHNLTEVGTMNMFVLLRNERGETELVTPPLDGTILPGVTRDSILQLARQWNEFRVSERSLPMRELIDALNAGRVIEAFGAGTAAIVSPIKAISYKGKEYSVPLDPSDPNAGAGKLTARLADAIMAIQYGEVEHPWSVVVE